MAKRKRENNEKQNEKKRKEGRGEGSFENYEPLLKIQDVGSTGLVTRIKGTKTGRCHQLLSSLELDYFYLLDWAEEVIDIREQYPLDLKETLALANEIGLVHPPKSNPTKPIVMTTDFLITIRQPIGTNEVARTVKYSKDLTNSRVLEKFDIERLYWNERSVDWGIVTELDINKNLVRNLKWLYKNIELSSLPSSITPNLIIKMTDYIFPIIAEQKHALSVAAKECDKEFSLPTGNSLALVRYLIATRKWKVNMFEPIQPSKFLNLTKQRN